MLHVLPIGVTCKLAGRHNHRLASFLVWSILRRRRCTTRAVRRLLAKAQVDFRTGPGASLIQSNV